MVCPLAISSNPGKLSILQAWGLPQ